MFSTFSKTSSPTRGSVLFFVLVVTGVLAILIGSLLSASVTHRRLADREQVYNREFAAAEYALNKAFGELSYSLKKAGIGTVNSAISRIVAPQVPGYSMDQFQITVLDSSTGVLPEGHTWAGYNLRTTKCRIHVRAREDNPRYAHPGVALEQEFEITHIPLYVFGIFYSNDLEIHPSPHFVETGRVHTNANFYYGSDGNQLEIRNNLTAVGHIQYDRHPNSGRSLTQGRNYFWNGTDIVRAERGGRNLDWRYNQGGETWAQVADDLWNGHVKDSAMGVSPLNLPWPEVIPNIELIQPPNAGDFGPLLEQKLCYKAGLLISKNRTEHYRYAPRWHHCSPYLPAGQYTAIYCFNRLVL